MVLPKGTYTMPSSGIIQTSLERGLKGTILFEYCLISLGEKEGSATPSLYPGQGTSEAAAFRVW